MEERDESTYRVYKGTYLCKRKGEDTEIHSASFDLDDRECKYHELVLETDNFDEALDCYRNIVHGFKAFFSKEDSALLNFSILEEEYDENYYLNPRCASDIVAFGKEFEGSHKIELVNNNGWQQEFGYEKIEKPISKMLDILNDDVTWLFSDGYSDKYDYKIYKDDELVFIVYEDEGYVESCFPDEHDIEEDKEIRARGYY